LSADLPSVRHQASNLSRSEISCRGRLCQVHVGSVFSVDHHYQVAVGLGPIRKITDDRTELAIEGPKLENAKGS
jgi:hypothetical protein